MPTYETILVDRDGAIATITLHRPDKLNALNAQVFFDLQSALREVEQDRALRVVVLTGSGEKAFAAGADIAAMAEMTASEARDFSQLGQTVMAAIETARVPVIGAVNGFALGGGCELALACDFLYASDKAQFGQPEVNLAVIPGFGGTQRLARRIGIARARELCLTGDRIGAEEALRIGLVNAIVPHAELSAKVKQRAETIAAKGPLAITQTKRVILRGEGAALSVANELESQAFSSLFGSHDQREGMRAFLEKRAAKFDGR